MTSYIKMIDIWMIFMMLFPFFEVCLYTLTEVLKNRKSQIQMKKATGKWIDKDIQMNLRGMSLVYFSLDWGLPLLATIFIVVFWTIGLVSYSSSNVDSAC